MKDKPNLLFRPAIPFLDVQEVSLAESEGVAGELHLLAGGVHDVVDLTLHVLAILGGLVGLEGVYVTSLDWEGVYVTSLDWEVHVSSSRASEAGT